MPVVRPCLVHRCPNYAEPGGSYCAEHIAEARKGRSSPGTTPAWARARLAALERDGLVNRLDRFVQVTRAAVRGSQLAPI